MTGSSAILCGMLKTYRGRMDRFFPSDDPVSPWLIRLAAIRDDISFEISGFEQARSGQTDDVWRGMYFFRRMHISISEATAILNYEASKAVKDGLHKYFTLLQQAFADWGATLRESASTVTSFRDAVGAHMRPSNADQERKQTDPGGIEREGLRKCSSTPCTLVIDMNAGATSFRAASVMVPVFQWIVEEDEDSAIISKAMAVFPILQKSALAVMHAIDALICSHWAAKGIFSDEDLAKHGLIDSTHRERESGA
jgi:hypothetical protein